MKYTKVCKEMLKHDDWKNRMVKFIMSAEKKKVVGFDRDEFMEEMVRCKKEVEK